MGGCQPHLHRQILQEQNGKPSVFGAAKAQLKQWVHINRSVDSPLASLMRRHIVPGTCQNQPMPWLAAQQVLATNKFNSMPSSLSWLANGYARLWRKGSKSNELYNKTSMVPGRSTACQDGCWGAASIEGAGNMLCPLRGLFTDDKSTHNRSHNFPAPCQPQLRTDGPCGFIGSAGIRREYMAARCEACTGPACQNPALLMSCFTEWAE